eukprot:1156899-Pelagomonas_calceolata.AAC.3
MVGELYADDLPGLTCPSLDPAGAARVYIEHQDKAIEHFEQQHSSTGPPNPPVGTRPFRHSTPQLHRPHNCSRKQSAWQSVVSTRVGSRELSIDWN